MPKRRVLDYILSFGAEVGGGADQRGPRGVTEDEFRETVSAYWTVDDVHPALLYGNATAIPEGADAPDMARFVDGESHGRPDICSALTSPSELAPIITLNP